MFFNRKNNRPLFKKNRLSLFSRFMLLLNILSALMLLLSYFSPYTPPYKLFIVSFLGLAYPFLLIGNMLFVAYWIILSKRFFFLSLLSILIGFNHLGDLFQISFKGDPAKSLYTSKIVSFNVRVFDLYNWTQNRNTRDKMFNMFKEEAPDILCLQEFYVDDSRYFTTLDTIIKLQPAKYYHVDYTKTLRNINHWGIATFSSYPILKKGRVLFKEKNNNICIFTDVKINEDTVRIYNMHLQSIHFSGSDYKILKDLQTAEIDHSKNLMRRINNALIKRSRQAEQVAAHIRNCKYPVIICGDFNDTPSSYSYQTISNGMIDAFKESGNGFGRTYIGKFPSFRIDYILHSQSIDSYDFRTIKKRLSDHHPLSCLFAVESHSK